MPARVPRAVLLMARALEAVAPPLLAALARDRRDFLEVVRELIARSVSGGEEVLTRRRPPAHVALPAHLRVFRRVDAPEAERLDVPAAWSMARLAADVRLHEVSRLHIEPDGVAAVAAAQRDGHFPAVPALEVPLPDALEPYTRQQRLGRAVVAHELLLPLPADR